jgi:hypothetical protein
MEEEKKSSETKSLLSVLKKKKNTEEKKKDEKKSKDDEALAKVQELLKNTPAAALVGATNEAPVKKEFDMEEHKQERSQKWLEDQVNELNRQVEEYENEIVFYKEEMRKMQDYINSGSVGAAPQHGAAPVTSAIDSSMNHTLIELFKHFENLHFRYNQDGNFAVKVSFPSSGNGILEKFLEYFPQLQNVKRYTNRGF